MSSPAVNAPAGSSSSLQTAGIQLPGCPRPTCGLAPQRCASSSQRGGRPQIPDNCSNTAPGSSAPCPTRPKALRAPAPLTWRRRPPRRRLSPTPTDGPPRHHSHALRWARVCRSPQLPRLQIQRDPGGCNQGLWQSRTPQCRSAPVIGVPPAPHTLDAAG
ncbi:hypothetical protein NDU88_007071 [Pleurodeles waltl]|uniref:Uncharacterized protein n=1 Tax=Pleurodeles waltl TaxID=8319 RepID=A0AAV7WCE5_PLEWA|nr:hypothetical protein NDU88_007071 [Pleurodeles waltl]